MGLKPNIIKYDDDYKFAYWMKESLDENGKPFQNSRLVRKCKSPIINWVFFCPSCSHGARLQDWGVPTTKDTEQAIVANGVCPHCGQNISLTYALVSDYCPDFYSPYSYEHCIFYDVIVDGVEYAPVKINYTPQSRVVELRWWPMNEQKLTFEVVYKELSGGTMYEKYWKHEAYVHHRIIFNRKTGLVYSKRPRYRDGKHSKMNVLGQNPNIRTLDSLYDVFPNNCIPDVKEIFVQEMQNAGYDIYFKEMPSGADRKKWLPCASIMFHGKEHNINELAQLFYWRDCSEANYRDFRALFFKECCDKDIKRMFPRVRDLASKGEVEWLPKYMQKTSIRRRLLNRASLYYYYKWMYAMGIRDINVMNTVVDAVGHNDSVWDIARLAKKEVVDMVVHYIKDKPAHFVSRFLISMFNQRVILADTRRMFARCCEANLNLPENASTLYELHEALTAEWNRAHVLTHAARFQNMSISYSDRENELVASVDNLNFCLPADTDTLRNIGSSMHICVGSYDQRAINKDCTIMYVSDAQTSKYIACLELLSKKERFVLQQCKAYCNMSVGDEIATIKKWLEDKKIVFEDNYDYRCAIRNYNHRQATA